MDIKKDVIDVHYKDLNNKYYTIDEIEEILELDQSKILYYCKKLSKYLDVATVDMFHVFNNIDIENLRRIKHLDIDENMSMKEIEEYLLSHQQEIIIRKDENTSIDKSFLNILAGVFAEQNRKIDMVLENNSKMIDIIEKLLAKQDQINETLNSISNEVAVTRDTNEKIDKLRESMEHRKEESEKEQKKGILDRIFKR